MKTGFILQKAGPAAARRHHVISSLSRCCHIQSLQHLALRPAGYTQDPQNTASGIVSVLSPFDLPIQQIVIQLTLRIF